MLNHGIELTTVSDRSAELANVRQAAEEVVGWLADSPDAADKPMDEILDPQFLGMFAFSKGEAIAYVAQRQIEPLLREIGSLVVKPNWRRKGFGTRLLDTYAYDLQTNTFPGSALVAVVHAGSQPVFEAVGFENYQGEIPADPSGLHERAQKTGKALVSRTMADASGPILF